MAQTTYLRVEGMTCMMCVKHVANALPAVPGVEGAKVSLSEKRAAVLHGEQATVDALIAAVKQAGYEATVEV
ncbi:MAG: cation transporter [Fimbriimonadales bacterium]|nr:cation transporter [Fimbriimonadales bacterium]